MRKQWIAAAAAAVLLAACNNDNGGGSDGVDLSSTTDVQREITNYFSTIYLALESPIEVGISEARPSGASDPTVVRARHLLRLQRPLARAAAPKVVTNCAGGGSDDQVGDIAQTYSFTLLPGSPSAAVTAETDAFTGCTDGNSVYVLNGALASGDNSGADAAVTYTYLQYGSGSTPLQVKETSGSTATTYEALGNVEESVDDSDTVDTVVAASVVAYSTGAGEIDLGTASSTQGTTGTPFNISIDDTAQTITATGPYRYTGGATGCKGGVVTVFTPTPVTVSDSDSSGPLLTGGILGLRSGSSSVTVTFASDGSATLAGSVTGTLTAAQVQAAIEATSCAGFTFPVAQTD